MLNKTVNVLKVVFFLIIFNIIGWFVADFFVWLELLMKFYTKIGAIIMSIGTHALLIFFATAFALMMWKGDNNAKRNSHH